MLCMTQRSAKLLRPPYTPPISVHRTPRHHQSTKEEHPRQDPPAATTRDTAGPVTSHPWDHPAPPSRAHLAQNNPKISVDALDLDSLPRETPPDPGNPPPPTPATISAPDLLRATLQGRALDTPLGLYRLQESYTKLTVNALRDLVTPGQGLREDIVDLVVWRARQHIQGQHIWIRSIKWGQALTHDTDTNVTRQGTTRLRRAPAEKDHQADPSRPDQWEQATAPTRNTALRAAVLCTPHDDLPPPAYRQAPTPCLGAGAQSSSAGTTT